MTLPTPKNRLGMSITSVASSGTGTITLNAATSGYEAFAAGDDGKYFDCLFVEGSNWEVARNCLYTHSGTTLTRGTLEDSSNSDSAITLSNAGTVYVTHTAERIRQAYAGWLDYSAQTLTSGNATVYVNTLHDLDISGLTAARDFVLPATAAAGDRVAVRCSTDAPATAAYVLQIKNASGDTIDGTDHSSTIKTALIIKGEVMVFRCVTANSAWIVEKDDRIPCHCRLTNSGTLQTSAGTYYYPDWTVDYDNANLYVNATKDYAAIRRNGKYLTTVYVSGHAGGAAYLQYNQKFLDPNGTPAAVGSGVRAYVPTGERGTPVSSETLNLSAGNQITVGIAQGEGASKTSSTISFCVLEVLR